MAFKNDALSVFHSTKAGFVFWLFLLCFQSSNVQTSKKLFSLQSTNIFFLSVNNLIRELHVYGSVRNLLDLFTDVYKITCNSY